MCVYEFTFLPIYTGHSTPTFVRISSISLCLCLVFWAHFLFLVSWFLGFIVLFGVLREKEREKKLKTMASSSTMLEEGGSNVNGEMIIPHVLAVDDSIVDRKLIERLLTNSACRVTTAENGQKALEFLGLGDEEHTFENTHSKVNLIITDYCMPIMTGYELLKKIKESSNLKEIPVVIVSSENVPNRIEKCLEGGAQEFMLKPLKQSDVKKLRCHIMKVWSIL